MNRRLLILASAAIIFIALIIIIILLIYGNILLPYKSSTVKYHPTSSSSEIKEGTYSTFTSKLQVFVKFLDVEQSGDQVIARSNDFNIIIFNKGNKLLLTLSKDPNNFHDNNQRSIIIRDIDLAITNIQNLRNKLVEVQFDLADSCNKKLLFYLEGELGGLDCMPTARDLASYEN